MKLTIAGAGVSGSYLARLLKDYPDVEFTIYDDNPMPGCACGWGVPRSNLEKLLKKVDLDLDDFVLSEMNTGILNGVAVPVQNAVVINKPKLIRLLLEGINVIPEKYYWHGESAGLRVNATGKPRGGIQHFIKTYQKAVEINGLKEKTSYVYINPKHMGYGWIFPLDEKAEMFHFGAGSFDIEPKTLMDMMLHFYKIKTGWVRCGCKQSLIAAEKVEIVNKNYVAIGGAAGAVHPITGGGIIPSMEMAYALFQRVSGTLEWSYTRTVDNILTNYGEAFKITYEMLDHTTLGWLSALRHIRKHSQTHTKPEFTLKNRAKMIFNTLKLL